MDTRSKQELALAILAAHDRRERSYDPIQCRYTMTVAGAVELTVRDEDLKVVVLALLTPGYSDIFDWAETTLAIRADIRLVEA